MANVNGKVELFPTNPINALEASNGLPQGCGEHPRFPTNPINALEASQEGRVPNRLHRPGFQLIQLTHWKREAERISAPSLVSWFPTNPINALEARQDLNRAQVELVMFPTNPINALEASTSLQLREGFALAFPTNPINALEASPSSLRLLKPRASVSN